MARRGRSFAPHPWILVALVAAPPAAGSAAEVAERQRVREVATRAVALLQQSAQTWAMTQGCVSCHHQGLGTVAVAVAREKGLATDARKLEVQVERMTRRLGERLGQHAFGLAGANPAIGESYGLWALAAAGRPGSVETDVLVHALAGRQGAGGGWASVEHQPPLEDSPVTATALTLRALVEYAPPGRAEEMAARVERARRFLAAMRPRETEEAVFRILGLGWAGAPMASELGAAVAELRAAQRPDGGWAQLPTRASDAYATGQALVALHQVGGEPVAGETFRRGIAFLLGSVDDRGAWLVESRRRGVRRPHVESGFPFGRDQFVSYAGTAWATMALGLALEPGATGALSARPRGRVAAEGATGLPPVVAAALLGGVDDLARALDGCAGELDAERGPYGLTPLIAAVPDPRKVELLLARGADPGAVTEIGLGAIHVASFYDGATPSLERLLDRDARVERPTTLGLLPVYLAAIAGRVDATRALVGRGASLDRWSVGSPAPDPLLIAVRRQDEAMVELLLAERPGGPWGRTEEGYSPLVLAVQARSEPLVARLLRAGADPGRADREGESTLHWAVMVDPGHDRIVRMLLDAGADAASRNAYGQAAAETARAFGHPHLARWAATEER
ncbi:MAG TPA: ankyrin repeat domain-containing protein [Thermoanaerobaculia bacterium]|nr:ankyrin repeat domain-containing protein [Thermoanaerobaculia bacterium]